MRKYAIACFAAIYVAPALVLAQVPGGAPPAEAWKRSVREAGPSQINLPVKIPLKTIEAEVAKVIPRPITEGKDRVKVPIVAVTTVFETILVTKVIDKMITEIVERKESVAEKVALGFLMPWVWVQKEIIVKTPVPKWVKETITIPEKVAKEISNITPVEAEVRYRVDPGPLRLAVEGPRLRATMRLAMKVETSLDVKVLVTDLAKLDPVVDVVASAALAVDGNRLVARDLTLDAVDWKNIGPLGDILNFGPINDRIKEALAGELSRAMGSVDLKPSLEKVWGELGKPIALPDQGLTLDVRPEGLAVSSISGDADVLQITLGLTARPSFRRADKLMPAPKPLPTIGPISTEARGWHVESLIEVPLSRVRDALNGELGRVKLPPPYSDIRLAIATIYATHDEQLVALVDIRKSNAGSAAVGTIAVTARPVIEEEGQRLRLKVIDVSSRDPLLGLMVSAQKSVLCKSLSDAAVADLHALTSSRGGDGPSRLTVPIQGVGTIDVTLKAGRLADLVATDDALQGIVIIDGDATARIP